MKRFQPAYIATLIALWLAGCSGAGQVPEAAPQQAWLLPGLPNLPHVVSASDTIDGSAHDASGEGVTDEPPVALLDAAELTAAWTQYSFGLSGKVLTSITIDVSDVSGEYWVGLADYNDRHTWEWHGPYSAAAVVTPARDAANYMSDSDNIAWVIVAPRDASLRVLSSTVDYAQAVIFHVPPAGTEVAMPLPVLNPSLVIMPDDVPTAEPGAPVIFYFGGENTYYAYYDGAAWVQQVALPDSPVITFPVARGMFAAGVGQPFMVALAGYDAIADQPVVYLLNDELGLDSEYPAEETGEGALTMLAMDAVAGAWVIAEARTSGDDATVTASIHSDEVADPPVYQATVVAEDVAGLDVAWGEKPAFAYSHGVTDTSETILLDFSITAAELDIPAESWQAIPADYEAPLSIDLGRSSTGELQMLFIAGRDLDFVIPFVFELHATLFYDVVLGTHSESGWTYDLIFESDVVINFFLNKEIEPDLGVSASFAGSDALSYARVDGVVQFTTDPEFAITGGELINHTHFMERNGGGFNTSTYFTGDTGAAMSWQENPAGDLCCAYLRADTMDIDEFLGGNMEVSSELLYWSP